MKRIDVFHIKKTLLFLLIISIIFYLNLRFELNFCLPFKIVHTYSVSFRFKV